MRLEATRNRCGGDQAVFWRIKRYSVRRVSFSVPADWCGGYDRCGLDQELWFVQRAFSERQYDA